MDLICPQCRAVFVIADAQNATCAAHDGRYQILFDRSADPAVLVPPTAPAPKYPAAGPAPPPLDIPCQQHPDVQAVMRCRICSKGACAVCDFELPGNVHVCPACLEKEPATEVSAKRRKLMVIGLVLGAFSTLMLIMTASGAFFRMFGGYSQALDVVVTSLMRWPAQIGVGLSVSALDQRLGNSMGMWIAVVWNALLLGIVLLLIIIGLAK